MRVFLQVFLPFGLLIVVLLTPIYLQRDFGKDDSDAIISSTTTIATTSLIPTTTISTETRTSTTSTSTTSQNTTTSETTTLVTTPTTTTETTAAATTTTTLTTTTTTEQDKLDPCPFQCSNHSNCKVIVGDIPLPPHWGTPMGTIFAAKQFRLNIGIDFPSNGAKQKANIVHERAYLNPIHTGTEMEKFGDGYFSVFNPQDETRKLEVTTSNNSTDLTNSIKFSAIVGQFQCINVEQILNEETQKLDHKIKFNGNTILSREYDPKDVFTGDLEIWISDKFQGSADKYKVRNFVYETIN